MTAVTLEAAVEVSPAEVDAVVVSLVVAVAVTLAVFADAGCALSAPVVLACSRVAALLLAAASALVRTSASVALTPLLVVLAPRLPSPNTVAHMQTSRTSAVAATRRRSTFVRRTLARRMRAASGDRDGVRAESSLCMQAVWGRRLCSPLAAPENPLGAHCGGTRGPRVGGAMADSEAIETFPCFGTVASVIVRGPGPGGAAPAAAALARRRLEDWHLQFSRFEADSELSQLNRDPRAAVPVSAVMARLIDAILAAGRSSGGLVDGTLVTEIERAGYAEHLEPGTASLAAALAAAPPRAPAGRSLRARMSEVSVDVRGGVVRRPPGLRFDSGGIAKGLFGDILAPVLGLHEGYALDCGGDIRVGGTAGLARPVRVASPFDESILHTFELSEGAVATSGIGRRSWLDADGRPAHHLLDPATGRPAFTGVVQVTAIAPTVVEAEVLAKTALLRGADRAAGALRHGGVVVYDDASAEILEPA